LPPVAVVDFLGMASTTWRAARARAARRKQIHPDRPVAVAVRACWVDGEADGIRAEVVLFDGHRYGTPTGSVLVFRARQSVDVPGLEDELERRAAGYPAATALREMAAEIDRGLVDERLWLDSKAA
jgi:hypothetical protein